MVESSTKLKYNLNINLNYGIKIENKPVIDYCLKSVLLDFEAYLNHQEGILIDLFPS
jgi:hypothetical protein